MTALEKRNAIVSQAREWLGLNEANGSFRAIIDLYNRMRPPDSYRMTYSDPWCAAFVSAVGMAVGLGDIILPECACDRMIEEYRAKGQWVEDDAYNPKPGDLIFYDWQDSGAGDNQGSSDHVGIVVEADGNLFTIIEGNYSDSVKKRYVYRDGQFIRGFAVPGYADDATGVDVGDKDPEPEKPVEEHTAKTDGEKLCEILPVLSFGCCGVSVVRAQGLLIALKFSCGPDGADGDFGYNTRVAVRNFQRGAGLPETGKIDALTWAKMLGV